MHATSEQAPHDEVQNEIQTTETLTEIAEGTTAADAPIVPDWRRQSAMANAGRFVIEVDGVQTTFQRSLSHRTRGIRLPKQAM